ncbi:HAMP domain-containing histidine kinase, partial [Salmonella sp. hn-h4]
MDAMISEILEYAAAQSGVAAQTVTVDLVEVAKHVADEFAPGSVSLSVTGRAPVEAGPERVRRVLLNLVQN